MSLDHIPLSALTLSPFNLRRPETAGPEFQQLLASIQANGLLEPLIVEPARNVAGGPMTYEVLQGGNRLAALQHLMAQALLPWDMVPCQIFTDLTEAEAREVALATSVIRRPLHPVDEYEAYAALAAEGLDATAIAHRFGISLKGINQRLALGRLAPEVRAAWRSAELTADEAMAFTAARDWPQQVDALDVLRKAGERGNDPWRVQARIRKVRATLMENRATAAESKEWKLVGEADYVAAGGLLTPDLFADDVVIEDVPLLTRLAREKALARAEAFRLTHGFGAAGFVDTLHDLDRYEEVEVAEDTLTDEEEAEAKAIEAAQDALVDWELINAMEREAQNAARQERIAAEKALDRRTYALEERVLLRRMTPEQRAACMVFARIVSDGTVELRFDRLMPGALAKLGRGEASQHGEGEDDTAGPRRLPTTQDSRTQDAPPPAAPEADDALSQKVVDELAGVMTRAARSSLLAHPEGALYLLLASLRESRSWNTPIGFTGERGAQENLAADLTHLVGSGPEMIAHHIAAETARRLTIGSHNLSRAFTQDLGGVGSVLTFLQARDEAFQQRLRDLFDVAAFFHASCKGVALAAAAELGLAAPGSEAMKILAAGTKKDAVEPVIGEARRRGWLPALLRTPRYALLDATATPARKAKGAAKESAKPKDAAKGKATKARAAKPERVAG
jgi:ParB family transcriptional regulator, chromosome partitioning protein